MSGRMDGEALTVDLFAELGIDRDDPEVVAAVEDAEEHARLIETLVTIRRDRKLTQTDVARSLGIRQPSVSDFERVGGDPKLSTVQRYARALGCRVRFAVSTSDSRWESLGSKAGTATWSPMEDSSLDAPDPRDVAVTY